MGLFDWAKKDKDKDKKKDDDKARRQSAQRPAARSDKPKADFSNVRSGSSSAPAPAPTKSAAPAAQTYEIKSGDTLWKIAEKHYGDGNQWRKIHEANKDEIKDPDKIYPGQKIVIPKA